MFMFKVYTHEKKPVTFDLPPDKRRINYTVDCIVKVVILPVPLSPKLKGERIWVRILKGIDEFGYYEASWSNVPLLEEAIKLKEFPIHYTNIIDCWGKYEELKKPEFELIRGGKT